MWNAGNWPENALNLEHGKTEIGPEDLQGDEELIYIEFGAQMFQGGTNTRDMQKGTSK